MAADGFPCSPTKECSRSASPWRHRMLSLLFLKACGFSPGDLNPNLRLTTGLFCADGLQTFTSWCRVTFSPGPRFV